MNKRICCWMARLLVVIVGLGSIPTQTTHAAIPITQEITPATQEAFAKGTFGLTTLSPSNGVQMLPVGVSESWQASSKELCRPIANAGYASFKNQMFIIGGLTGTGQIVKDVCRTTVTAATGTVNDWTRLLAEDINPSLFDLQAVAVPLPNDSTKGVLIIAGGRLSTGASVNTVKTALINADGSIGAWQDQPVLGPSDGLRADFALTAYTRYLDNAQLTSQTFLYAIGGVDYDFPGLSHQSILRATVTATGGVSAWEKITDVPIVPLTAGCSAATGLMDASAVNLDIVTEANNHKRALVIMGGIKTIKAGDETGSCPIAEAPSSDVYVALIDETTGNLTWQPTVYTLPDATHSMAAVGYNQKLYANGGLTVIATNNTDTRPAVSTLLSSYFNESEQLPALATNNFFKNTTEWAAFGVRRQHGMLKVTVNNRDLLFVVGGSTVAGRSGYLRNALFTTIGTNDDIDAPAGYPSQAIYLSQAYEMQSAGRITEMKWTASISSTGTVETDLEMNYRVAPTLAELQTAAWNEVDGDGATAKFSVNGANTATSTAPAAGKYVQYRALLRTNRPNQRDATPILRGPVIVSYNLDGYPSLHITTATMGPIEAATESVPSITLANNIPPGSPSTGTVLDADVTDDGTFFVDLYLFPPGTDVITPTRDASGAYPLGEAFAVVNKANLPADSTFTIPSNEWRATCGESTNCPPPSWKLLFRRPGIWTVIVIVDSGNNVPEDNTINDPRELDNLYRMTVQSNYTAPTIQMPFMKK